MMARKTGQIRNADGLHFRSWLALVQLARRFESDIRVTWSGSTVDGKQMSSLVILADKSADLTGGVVEIEAVGSDAETAVNAIWCLVEDGFGERAPRSSK